MGDWVIKGVSRMADNDLAYLILANRPLTDDELRELHELQRTSRAERERADEATDALAPLDAVVHELGIEDDETIEPVEAVRQLKAQAAAMQAALEAEIIVQHDNGETECLRCFQIAPHDRFRHAKHCVLTSDAAAQALATDAGKKVLDAVEALRVTVAEIEETARDSFAESIETFEKDFELSDPKGFAAWKQGKAALAAMER